jgi:NACHT domain
MAKEPHTSHFFVKSDLNLSTIETMKLLDKLSDLNKWALGAFEDTVPEDVLCNSRKSGEAFCKAILLKHYGDEDGIKIIRGEMKRDRNIIPARNPRELNFETLINYISDDQDYIVISNKTVRNKIRSNLHVIQSYCNPANHDPNSEEVRIDPRTINHVRFTLTELIIWFYEQHLRESLPALLTQYVADARSNYVKGDDKRASYEDVRGLDIVKLCYPKQKITLHEKHSDNSKKIGYEFIAVEVAKNNIVGHLFVKEKITIDNTLQHFLGNLNITLSSLRICSPRVIIPETGREVDRRRSISDKFINLSTKKLSEETEYFFIDDFVWNNCLSQNAEEFSLHIDQEEYFIDQELYQVQQNNNQSDLPQLSLDFVRELLEFGEQKNPISIIVGEGGVGKTTFCEQAVGLINVCEKKKALLISSTDLRDIPPDAEVKSVTDLYKLFSSKIRISEVSDSLEPSNLEINISCGNIILIIDGLDEIESMLGANFKLDEFLSSAIALNETYRRCCIVITSRDYYLDRYVQKDSINTFTLCGFSHELVDKYLEKRLISPQKIRKAKKYISEFEIAEKDHHIPLYISLISDLLEREEIDQEEDFEISESKYYYDFPLDNLVYQLLRREIVKQSLDITCDDYFELLAEVSVIHKGSIDRKDLNDYIECLFPLEITGHDDIDKYKQIYVSPVLVGDENSASFKIKYNFMEIWIQSRLFLYNYKNGNCTNSMLNLLSELYDGSALLLEELVKVKMAIPLDYVEQGKSILKKLMEIYESAQDRRQVIFARKAISGLLYFCLAGNNNNKSSNTDIIIRMFGANKVYKICIFGKFFPLDFTHITIYEGWFEQYDSFDKCNFPKTNVVFYDSTFKSVNPKINMISNTNIFDNCKLNDELKRAVDIGNLSIGNISKRVRDDITRLLKVGYDRGCFSWKSEGVYLTGAALQYTPPIKYLNFLTLKNVLTRIPNKDGSKGDGYVVSEHFKDCAKQLITNTKVKSQMNTIIKDAMKEFYNVESKK